MSEAGSRGRPKGGSDKRESIREAARAQFAADGYDAVTMRSIASAAGVDVALVSYYFGSKRGLFSAAMALPINPADVVSTELADDLDTLAERLLRRLLTVWDTPVSGGPLIAATTVAVSDPAMKRLVAEGVTREIIAALVARLDGPDRETRAAAFAGMVSGLIFSRYLLTVEPLATLPPETVIQQMAPPLQSLLTPADTS
jgi:AcrR family transcriptional regulator